MSESNHITRMISTLTGQILPLLAKEDITIVSCLKNGHIDLNENGLFPLEFNLVNLFDAVWIWCSKYSDIELPLDSDWKKDYKIFCDQIMNPWPVELFRLVGLQIRSSNKAKVLSKLRYEISMI